MRDETRMRYLGKKLDVRVQRYRHPGVQQELVGQIKDLDVALARIGSADVSDVLIKPESLSAALLAEHQDWSKLIFTARASSRTRAVTARDRYLQIAAQRHAEPVRVRIDEVELGADCHIARAI